MTAGEVLDPQKRILPVQDCFAHSRERPAFRRVRGRVLPAPVPGRNAQVAASFSMISSAAFFRGARLTPSAWARMLVSSASLIPCYSYHSSRFQRPILTTGSDRKRPSRELQQPVAVSAIFFNGRDARCRSAVAGHDVALAFPDVVQELARISGAHRLPKWLFPGLTTK